MGITNPCEPRGHRRQREVGELTRVDLVPLERSGDARVDCRADRVRARDRPILRFLVVVEKAAVTLFFPPLAGRESRSAPFPLPLQRQRLPPDLVERPAALDA